MNLGAISELTSLWDWLRKAYINDGFTLCYKGKKIYNTKNADLYKAKVGLKA